MSLSEVARRLGMSKNNVRAIEQGAFEKIRAFLLDEPQRKKRGYGCGACGGQGHNRMTCPVR